MSVVWRLPPDWADAYIYCLGTEKGDNPDVCYKVEPETGLLLVWEGRPEPGELLATKSVEW